MLTPIKDTQIVKRFLRPPGDPPDPPSKDSGGTISLFPNAPLDMPTETFKKAMERRDENRRMLLQWIKSNLKPDIDYGRVHLNEWCQYARAGSPNLCRDITHWSTPMLFKSGAERITGVLGLIPCFPNLHQYELAAVHKQEISTVVLKCELKTSSGRIGAEGAGASDVKQLNGDLNFAIKTASRRAFVDAVVKISALSGVFNKTNRRTLTRVGVCQQNTLPGGVDCHKKLQDGSACNVSSIGPVTSRQKDFILKLAANKGLTIEGLEKESLCLFTKGLEDLDKVEGSRLIQHFKG